MATKKCQVFCWHRKACPLNTRRFRDAFFFQSITAVVSTIAATAAVRLFSKEAKATNIIIHDTAVIIIHAVLLKCRKYYINEYGVH